MRYLGRAAEVEQGFVTTFVMPPDHLVKGIKDDLQPPRRLARSLELHTTYETIHRYASEFAVDTP